MPLTAYITLESLGEASLDQFTGRGVHGFWFGHWKRVDPTFGDELHAETQLPAFSLSPLMGLPRAGRGGVISIAAGDTARLKISALTDGLAEAMKTKWLPALEARQEVEIPESREEGEQVIPGVGWKVTSVEVEECTYQELARRHLMETNPPRSWRLEFLTPTASNRGRTPTGKDQHLPFLLPEVLVASWLRRWQAFAPLALPEDEIREWAGHSLAVSAFRLHTAPAREGRSLRVGCVGSLTLVALDMPPYLRAAVDLLAAYSIFCGSGVHTAQGMGQTHCLTYR